MLVKLVGVVDKYREMKRLLWSIFLNANIVISEVQI
jgi:hypothetical protein